MKVYTLWTADAWLMRSTFELHGVFSSLEKALAYAKKYHLKDPSNHVLVDCGAIDTYEASGERVFSTENGKDDLQLQELEH